MTEGQIRVAIAVLDAYQRGDIANDTAIDDALYDELTEAIEAALEEMPPYTALST
jgi:hypothetical protein